MIYKPIINYVLAAGIALGAALTPINVNAQESLEKVVCTYDEQNGSLCSCQPKPKITAPKPKPLTCEQRCEKDYKERNEECAKPFRDYNQEQQRSGSMLGSSWPSERYSYCNTPLVQKRRLCFDACEEGHPEEADRMIKYGKCKDRCYHTIPSDKSYIDQIQEEKKRLGVKRRLTSEQLKEFESGYHQREREYTQKIEQCLKKCGKDPYHKQDKYRRIQGLGKIDTGFR